MVTHTVNVNSIVGGGTADEVQRRDEEEGRGLVGMVVLWVPLHVFEDVGFGVD